MLDNHVVTHQLCDLGQITSLSSVLSYVKGGVIVTLAGEVLQRL